MIPYEHRLFAEMIGKKFAEISLSLYENCLVSRYLDERLQQLFYAGVPIAPFLSGIGAEVGPATVATLLRPEDSLVPHYRGFSEIIAKRLPLENIAGELLRKEIGTSKGYGDACPFHNATLNIFGSSIVLGTKFSIVTGIGLASKLRKESSIVAVFFGDGEASRSTFGSALNLASLWNLPILFVCRNNGLSIDAKIEEMSSTRLIAKRAQGYDIAAITVGDIDTERLYEKSAEAITFVREQHKPFLLEITEKRFGPHLIKSRKGALLGNMLPENDDPLHHLEKALKKNGVTENELSTRKEMAVHLVETAIKTAMDARKTTLQDFFSVYYE